MGDNLGDTETYENWNMVRGYSRLDKYTNANANTFIDSVNRTPGGFNRLEADVKKYLA